MPYRSIAVIVLLLLISVSGGCNARPRMANPAIDAITWENAGKTYKDTLQLRSDGTYHQHLSTRLNPDANNAAGSWRVLSAEKQLIILDDKTPIRLAHNDPPYSQWTYHAASGGAPVSPAEFPQWAATQPAPRRDLPGQDLDISHLLRP